MMFSGKYLKLFTFNIQQDDSNSIPKKLVFILNKKNILTFSANLYRDYLKNGSKNALLTSGKYYWLAIPNFKNDKIVMQSYPHLYFVECFCK